MKLQDLRDMDKDDFLGLLNLATKPSAGTRFLEGAGLFAVGLLVGAGAALLLAPKPGRELREDLRERVRAAAERARANAPDLSVDEDDAIDEHVSSTI